jgi:hypothetical protein
LEIKSRVTLGRSCGVVTERQGESMGDEMAAGLALCQASEKIDGKIAEIESLLLTLAMVHRNGARRAAGRESTTRERR